MARKIAGTSQGEREDAKTRWAVSAEAYILGLGRQLLGGRVGSPAVTRRCRKRGEIKVILVYPKNCMLTGVPGARRLRRRCEARLSPGGGAGGTERRLLELAPKRRQVRVDYKLYEKTE